MDINMEYEAMRIARADVAEASRRLQQGRACADRRVRVLLAEGWSGDAATSVLDAWEDWSMAAARFESGLDAMELLLGAAQRDLLEQDDASQRALDSISRRIVDRLG